MNHPVVSREEWLLARTQLLQKEKEFTQAREAMAEARRSLPWVKIEKDYIFQSSQGPVNLNSLFGGCSQLLIYHFMFGPDWEVGCKSCSFWADNFDNAVVHLQQRDVQLVAVSRAPLEKLHQFRSRMNWSFPWYSSLENDFNFDFHVSFPQQQEGYYNYQTRAVGEEMPGLSAFYKDASNQVFHTYSRYSRGLDLVNGTYHWLDMSPLGRDEKELPYAQAWVKLKDEY